MSKRNIKPKFHNPLGGSGAAKRLHASLLRWLAEYSPGSHISPSGGAVIPLAETRRRLQFYGELLAGENNNRNPSQTLNPALEMVLGRDLLQDTVLAFERSLFPWLHERLGFFQTPNPSLQDPYISRCF